MATNYDGVEPTSPQILTVPVKIDAFIFNAAVCGGSSPNPQDDENKNKAKIAPLSQPDYTLLRMERGMIQNDVLRFTDLHKTGPAAFNTRFKGVGRSEPHLGRQGVYIHWIVPRPYRCGSSVSQDAGVQEKLRARQGFAKRPPHRDTEESSSSQVHDDPSPDQSNQGDTAAADFRPAPARWMVIRKVEACDPPDVLPDVDAWVVESDRRQLLDNIPTSGVDLQVDYAPYLVGENASGLNETAIKEQAEVFIGYKESANTWDEDPNIDRVDLNLLNSSNQLFADYQPHNCNVFSMIDTLSYTDEQNNRQVVNSANVSYYVLGWHALESQDPFGNLDPNVLDPTDGKPVTRGDRLSALNMILDQTDTATKDGIAEWAASPDPTRVLCHGAMYNVLWEAEKKPPNVPADTFFEKLNGDVPVSVGTTPMDALITYINSHVSQDAVGGKDDIQKVEQDLCRIQKLLHARDDGVEAQNEADDIVYNWNYASSSGGSYFFLAGTDAAQGGKPTKPSPDSIAQLSAVNRSQRYLDALKRQTQYLRWDMFARWWQYVTADNPPKNQRRYQCTTDATTALDNLLEQIHSIQSQVDKQRDLIPDKLAQMGVLPPFHTARDPTMLVAGIESGWPWDFLHSLRARVDTQLLDPGPYLPTFDARWTAFTQTILTKLPQQLVHPATQLVVEFLALNPNSTAPPPEKNGYRLPLYHDIDKIHPLPDGTAPWRDRWEKSQAWFPLFLEWTAEYTHIPFSGQDGADNWTLDQRIAWKSDPAKMRYGIRQGTELADLQIQDKRTLSGRVLILPQASLNLQTIVEQIIDKLPDGYLTEDEIRELRDHLQELAFLSSPLSGFTDHLLTRVQGNHIKPTLRVPKPDSNSTDVEPFDAAINVASDVGFERKQLNLMGLETDLLPYGTLVPYVDKHYCPFKPVTHGQFRFTALNIIDKFGQAITAIDPTPTPVTQGPPPLYPCISEYYTPQPSNKDPKKANTVVADAEDHCQYVQIPPSINQPARLNSAFVDYFDADNATGAPAGWRPLDEWSEDFVWGWVLPNYADSGIQLFLPDGTFFREIRLGGPKGTTSSDNFLPFASPPVSTDPNFQQLELFAKQLTNKDYLHSFVSMVTESLGTSAPPPAAWSEFFSSVIGKPLALVKMAYSLELATAPYANHSDVNTHPPEVPLRNYEFGIQLGDASRVYDGLVAYFKPSATPSPGNTLDLGTLYTHFVPAKPGVDTSILTKIGPSNYPKVKPFWLDPMGDAITSASDQLGPAGKYTAMWNDELTALGALVDPFVPVHAYSGVLPTQATQLPAWTWQAALKRMTAFFHAGPLLTTTDVPAFEPAQELQPNYDPSEVLPGSGIGVPAPQAGEWAWLQPYSVEDKEEDSAQRSEGVTTRTAFMALGTVPVDERPRLEIAPYTAVEGYLQLSLEQPGSQ